MIELEEGLSKIMVRKRGEVNSFTVQDVDGEAWLICRSQTSALCTTAYLASFDTDAVQTISNWKRI